jgi:hypothetical protein
MGLPPCRVRSPLRKRRPSRSRAPAGCSYGYLSGRLPRMLLGCLPWVREATKSLIASDLPRFCLRREVKTLHLATALRLDGPESDTTHRSAVGIAGKQQFTSRRSILTRHGLHLRFEVLIRQVDIQRGRIGSEQLNGGRQVIGRSDRGNTKRWSLVHVIDGGSLRLPTLIQRPAPFQTIIALLLGPGPVEGGLISPETPEKRDDNAPRHHSRSERTTP